MTGSWFQPGGYAPTSRAPITALAGRLAQTGRTIVVRQGTTIFRQEDPADGLLLITSGLVEIHCDEANGNTLVVNILASGQLFGEIALFDGGPRTAGARALRDTVLRIIPSAVLKQILAEDDQYRAGFEAQVAARLRWISAQLAERHHVANPVRAARWLLHLEQTVFQQSGRVALSQGEFANLVGITRETLARLLKTWRAAGLVSIERFGARHVICLTDRQGLQHCAQTALA